MTATYLHGHDGTEVADQWRVTVLTTEGKRHTAGIHGTEAAAIADAEAAYATPGCAAAWVREPDLTGWIVGDIVFRLGSKAPKK